MVTGKLVVDAQGITKSYGSGATRFDALKGVSLQVAAGESVAIVGKSGSGKSTLMHILALLDEPDAGSLRVTGLDARKLSAKQLNTLRNQQFGFVFQQFFLTPNTSVLDNVVLPLKIAGVSAAERRRAGMAVLERMELADKAGNRQPTPIQRASSPAEHSSLKPPMSGPAKRILPAPTDSGWRNRPISASAVRSTVVRRDVPCAQGLSGTASDVRLACGRRVRRAP